MTFREEEPAREWSAYAWTRRSRPRTSALYSPWQLLYVDDVLDAPAPGCGSRRFGVRPSSATRCSSSGASC
jgi:hypothetical protein